MGQPYGLLFGVAEEIERLRASGLQVVMPPNQTASFHYPGETLFVVVTLLDVEVRWLTEQARARQQDEVRQGGGARVAGVVQSGEAAYVGKAHSTSG